jgi:stage II sporulation protein M
VSFILDTDVIAVKYVVPSHMDTDSKQDSFFVVNGLVKKRAVILLSLSLLAGVACGAILSTCAKAFQDKSVLPLLFSGIPVPEYGIFSCFSTLLLNTLLCLMILFLCGLTVFGVFAVPAFVFLKGVAVGIGVISFLSANGYHGLAECVLLYTPAAAAASVLLLLFAVQALVFSERLAKKSLSSKSDTLNFKKFCYDFLTALVFAVALALVGSLPVALYSVFLP